MLLLSRFGFSHSFMTASLKEEEVADLSKVSVWEPPNKLCAKYFLPFFLLGGFEVVTAGWFIG